MLMTLGYSSSPVSLSSSSYSANLTLNPGWLFVICDYWVLTLKLAVDPFFEPPFLSYDLDLDLDLTSLALLIFLCEPLLFSAWTITSSSNILSIFSCFSFSFRSCITVTGAPGWSATSLTSLEPLAYWSFSRFSYTWSFFISCSKS